jgi:SAM-dependent methyltransferase
MTLDTSDPVLGAFFALHEALPRQGPGSDDTTLRLLALAGPLPTRPRALDLGCGPGRASLVLAAEANAHVTALDLHRPFLDELDAAAARRGLAAQIHTVLASMAEPPFPDRPFDLVWAEGSAYNIGFDTALRRWRRLLAPGGVLVVTECEWATTTPSPQAAAFWADAYPLRTTEQNIAAAREAGYRVAGVHPLPERDWWDEYYTAILDRLATADPTIPGMPEAIAAERAEIALRREHGQDYRYTGYVLRPDDPGPE